ncbi:MAG: phosphotransferase [Anaerolineales bacterium]|nr:phosphotransferase [Anaerolineales bacterium]
MFINFSDLEKTKPRVLIVENKPSTRVANQSLLMEWGYEPVLAMGAGASLIADAKRQAEEKRCSLALIDLRILDDDDEQDTSGLTLAEEMSDKLYPIILSGYENFNAIIKMLKELQTKKIEIGFVKKTEGPFALKTTLDEEAAKATASKRKLIFENLEILDEILKSPFGKNITEYPDQLVDVFARLFPNAKKLRLEKLDLRPASSNVSTVPRPNSVVLKVYEENYEPFVVKLARSEKIIKEVKNYTNHIHRRLTGYFSARLERDASLWDIGGAAYSYVGEFDVTTFSRFYEEKTSPEIDECLGAFFTRIWGRHYEQAHDEVNVSLFNLYSQVWDNWYEKRKDDFFRTRFKGSNLLGAERSIPEPIQWFKEKIATPSNDVSIVEKTRVGVTHGDLHGDNLLVDTQKNVWVIDFERCGEGHILQDFIELEADIFNRLEEHNENFPAYLEMCDTILKQEQIQGFDESEIASEDPRIEKALKTISKLRALARQHTKITDAREYLYGLLFNMMFRAAMIYKTDPQKNERPLLLAGLICNRLDHWGRPWPPIEQDLS